MANRALAPHDHAPRWADRPPVAPQATPRAPDTEHGVTPPDPISSKWIEGSRALDPPRQVRQPSDKQRVDRTLPPPPGSPSCSKNGSPLRRSWTCGVPTGRNVSSPCTPPQHGGNVSGVTARAVPAKATSHVRATFQDRLLQRLSLRIVPGSPGGDPRKPARLRYGRALRTSQDSSPGPRTLLLERNVERHQPLRHLLRHLPTKPGSQACSVGGRPGHRHPRLRMAAPAHGLDGGIPSVQTSGRGKPYDSILTFIDHLSGMCRFVPARAKDTAEDTAVHLINNVIRQHGYPDRIIADNDTRLRAGFWQALTKRLGVEMRHTSAYHQRANGKVENSHSTVYDILRSMVSCWGDNWAEHLPLAEFAFNSSVCASTGFSPFEVAYGRRPAFPGDLRGERSDVPRAEAAATRIIASTTACRDHFESSQLHNQEVVNRRQDLPVKVGDLVLLSTKDLVTIKDRTACDRLNSRFIGPFRVIPDPVN